MRIEAVSRRSFIAGVGAGALTLGVGSAAADAPDRHIVGTGSAAATAAATAAADRVHRVLDFGAIGQAVAGRFSERALARLAARRDVRYVEADGEYHAIAETLPWGVDRVDADRVHANGETGGDDTDGEGGADIAIIDTGIDDDHPDLDANVGVGRAFVGCRGSNCNYAWSDDHDHGTHCAGIADAEDNAEGVIGVSTRATLHAVKVLDNSGSGSWSDVAGGIEWTADQGYDVGSMSLGGSSGSQTVKDACQYAYDKGVLLVAAAGNSGPCSDCVGYPAKYGTVMAVSATSEDDSLAGFSSTGPEVELAAPGEAIYSTVIGSYDTFSGTSMACPHVSGAGAQLMDNGYTNAEARQRLTDTAEDLGLSSNDQGAGLLDVEAAVGGSSDSAPSVSWANPTDGDELSGTVAVQIDASDAEDADDSLTVEYRVDGGASRSTAYDSTSTYYEDSWDTTSVADGDHVLEATATDSAGNTATATIAVTTENTDDAPSVAWVNPADGDTVSGSVAIQIDASDDRDAGSDLTVEWQVDDGSWRTANYDSTSGYYEDSWDTTTVADGDHVLDARATDTSGNVSAEAGVTVTVSNTSTAPTVDSYTVTEAGSPNPHAEITADWDVGDADGDLDGVVVEVTDADTGSVVDSATTDVSGSDAAGADEFKIRHASGETFDVTLTVTDAAGNATAETQTVSE